MMHEFRRAGWLLGAALVLIASGVPKVQAQESDKPPGRGKTEVTVNGKKITIDYGRPSTDGAGYKSMQIRQVPDGLIWRMGKNARNKLVTESALMIGDTRLEAGSYSIWAKRVKDNWNLVFHSEADGWGLPSPKEGYVAELPLKHKALEKNVTWLTIELKKDGDDAVFKLLWGKDEGSAKLDLVD